MQVPKEIRSQVISLYIQGRSEQEIRDTVGLSQDQVNVILSDLSSPEYQNALSYQLAVTTARMDGIRMNSSRLTKQRKFYINKAFCQKMHLPL